MDDRQTKIREGAGLEDSRINQEFLDFLNKWSSPVLIVLAVAALVWAGMQQLEKRRNAKVDQAFAELEAATSGNNPSPTSLTTIAKEYSGVRGVPELAKLRAVDIYLRAFTIGLEPGAQIDPATRTVSNPDDILDEERRERYLSLAETTANEVLAASENKPGKALYALQALARLAAVMEGKKDFDGARSYYDRLKTMSEREQYASIAAFADARIAKLDELQSFEPLPTRDQVPPLPGETPAISQEQLDAIFEQARQQTQGADTDGQGDDPATEEPATEEPVTEEPSASENP